MADDLGDYGNFWSGDYWNSRATEQRAKDRKNSSQKIGQEKSKARTSEWNAIGTGLGVAGGITNFINSLPANKRKEEQKKQAIAPAQQKKSFDWAPGRLALGPNAPFQGNTNQFNPNGTRQGADDIPESTYRDGPGPQSALEILMERLNQGYQGGPDPSQMDFSALDKALQTRMGAIGNARNQVQGNFDKSDGNIEGMHRAFENQIRTEDAARYNGIADTAKANLNQNMNTSVGSMEAARAKASAERAAMMQNLGQQQMAGEIDPGEQILNEGINTAQLRNNTNQNMAEQGRATNLAYNNTVAQSVGQAGIQRRSALQNQLQGILGKLSMAESEAQAGYETEKQRAISGAGDAGYDQWNDQQGRNMDLFKILSNDELQREKMANEGGGNPQGMGALAENLGSIMAPEEASAGIAVLNKVLSGGNYLDGAQGPQGTQPYDRTAVLIQKLKNEGLPEHIATAVGISYDKL